ncbi:DNA ligase 4 [Glossina fuscipes]|uniref:DNA ligase 4 n=1 Tax=Glossina fuscipes TaxID=7396 RepID=A0A9C6DJI6_9MUSC|nr:DNA ligase 4 [Glossina fuscipes]
MEIAEKINFSVICSILQKIKDTNNKEKKLRYIEEYYKSFCKYREQFRLENHLKPEVEEDGSSSFYCVLRCLIPGADKGRPSYGLQIPSLGKVYMKILQLGANSRDAQILEARRFSPVYGDYAEKVYKVLKPRCNREPSTFKLKEIHDMLDVIAKGDRSDTEKILTQLSERASAVEQMWFIRLLLKGMHLSITDHQILNALHEQGKAFMQSCQNLLMFCCKLADNKLPSISLKPLIPKSGEENHPVISIFEHIRPQLCEIFPGHIETLMFQDVLYLETKMDGERFHIHYTEGSFKYFSRNGIDYSDSFGASSVIPGKLTSRLHLLLPNDLESIILDGEMMVWDINRKCYREKSENTDVKHLAGDRTWQPCFIVYDLLYFNGVILLQWPYIKRVYKLSTILKEEEGVLQLMKAQKITEVEQFKNLFQNALDKQQEGVVIKKQNATYRPGIRNGGGWYKLKADYFDGLTTEFDLLIIGGFYNRRRSFTESFLLGVLKYTNEKEYEVWSVAKVNNNITQRVTLSNLLKPRWRLVEEEPPPMWFHYEQGHSDGRPDVWIDPVESVILQIKATDLNHSPAFALKMTLHFPRIQCWRNDKLWNECLTLDEYQQIRQQNSMGKSIKKIVKRQVSLEDLMASRVKRKKMTAAQKRKLGLLSYERKFDVNQVEKETNVLGGFSVCILSASIKQGITPEYLKKMVIQHGGKLVENPLPDNANCIVVAGDKTYRVQSCAEKYDIVTMDWFMKFCGNPQHPLRPLDMVVMTQTLRQSFSQFYDKYGDHYTEMLISTKELKRIMDYMEIDANESLNDKDLIELENSLYSSGNRDGENKSPNFYRLQNAYFYSNDAESSYTQLLFEWHGGQVVNNLINLQEIHLIFINTATMDKSVLNDWLKTTFSHLVSNVRVVNIKWILHSHKERKLLDIQEYTWHDF